MNRTNEWVSTTLLCLALGCGSAREASNAPTRSPTVAADPEPTAEPEPGAEPEPTVDGVAATCEAIGHAAAETFEVSALFELVHESGAEAASRVWDTLREPFGKCLDAGEGAWVLVPVAVQLLAYEGGALRAAGPGVPGQLFELSYVVSYVAPDGTEHRLPPATLSHEIAADIPEGQSLKTFPPQDLDGDGVGELAYVVGSYGPDYGETKDTIVRFREGAVGTFDDFGEMHLTDRDDDGRFDVLVQRPWRCTFYNDMEGSSYESGCPWVLLHGTPDGFSSDDEVARAYLRQQCQRRPTRLIELDPEGGDYCWPERGEDARKIACARIWGASAAEVQARVRREYARLRRECRSEEQLAGLLAHAEHDPPLTLD